MLNYTKADWTKRVSNLSLRHRAFIGGKFVDARLAKHFNPLIQQRTWYWPMLQPVTLKM